MNPLTFAQVWLAVRPFRRLKENRAAKQTAKNGALHTQDVEQEAINGAELPAEQVAAVLKVASVVRGSATSKLVWLGVIQLVAGFSTAYVNDSLTAESSAALISGFLTIVFRAVTGESLAEKGA